MDLPVVFVFDDFDFGVDSDVDLPHFFTIPLYPVVVFDLTAIIFGTFLPNMLAIGLMPTATSAFLFTCAVLFGCLLIPPASDLPIVANILVDLLCLVPTKTHVKIRLP